MYFQRSDWRMTQWAVVQSTDFLLVGSVFTCATHPELIVHQRTTTHNACWEFGITIWTNLGPMKDENEKIKPGNKFPTNHFTKQFTTYKETRGLYIKKKKQQGNHVFKLGSGTWCLVSSDKGVQDEVKKSFSHQSSSQRSSGSGQICKQRSLVQ